QLGRRSRVDHDALRRNSTAANSTAANTTTTGMSQTNRDTSASWACALGSAGWGGLAGPGSTDGGEYSGASGSLPRLTTDSLTGAALAARASGWRSGPKFACFHDWK